MKKYVALISSALLVIAIPAPANSVATNFSVYQKTLATFSSTATGLTATQKLQVKSAVDSNPDAEKFVCTGIRYFSQPMSVNIMVRMRAKAACDYAKQLNPNLSTWYQNKPTQAQSYAGKVLLTVKTSLAPQSFESYSAHRISKLAFDSVASGVEARSKPAEENFEIVTGPSVTAEQLELETLRLENSLRFWSETFTQPFTAYLYTGQDADWLAEKLVQLGNSDLANLVKSNYWRETGNCTQSATAPVPGNLYMIQCINKDSPSLRMSAIFAHEYAHLPLMTKSHNQPAGYFSQIPVWLNEGGAQYFGIALTNQANDPTMKYWHDLHIHGSNNTIKLTTRANAMTLAELLPTITEAESVELLTKLENQSALSSSLPYSIGFWSTELLVAIKGADSYLKFLETMGPTKDWRAAFEEVYEIPVTDFYKAMTPYLNWLGKNFPA